MIIFTVTVSVLRDRRPRVNRMDVRNDSGMYRDESVYLFDIQRRIEIERVLCLKQMD